MKFPFIHKVSKTTLVEIAVVSLIALAFAGYRIKFEMEHPGEDWFVSEVRHNGHVYLIRDNCCRGNPPMIHSPDCPCGWTSDK